jgi:UDP-glucose:(heptosyl)LPS alpha-1,3-glucosyltransferase
MRLAFCLHNYFPFGGLQRDFLRIALACQARGHSITVFTMFWQGERPKGFDIRAVKASGLTNHGRSRHFDECVAAELRSGAFDLSIGFNKMSGLDFYFAADPCLLYRLRERSWLCRQGPRQRTYVALERQVFSPEGAAHIMILDRREQERYQQVYGTPGERFSLLPPGIALDRRFGSGSPGLRRALRQQYDLDEDDLLILLIGSGFRTKGVDRAIAALAALPEGVRCRCRLLIVGRGDATPYLRQARGLGVADRVIFAGARDDVPQFLFGADLLLHPARTEAYGMVLLEAMAAGLPVLVTDVCGYAPQIAEAGAGCLLAAPFRQAQLNGLLNEMLVSAEGPAWRRNGLDFVERRDVFSLPEKAADLIESRHRRGPA